MTTWIGKLSTTLGQAAIATGTPATAGYVPENELGAPDLVSYLRKQDLLNTHRLDKSYARYVVIDCLTSTMKVHANDVPGKTIDDAVSALPGAVAIMNGTWFSAEYPLQSLGHLRQDGVELATSLPGTVTLSSPPTPQEQFLDERIKAAKGKSWVGTEDGVKLVFGAGHPPPATIKTAIGGLLRNWPFDYTDDLRGKSMIAYNSKEQAALLFSRFAVTDSPGAAVTLSGTHDTDDILSRMRASGFGDILFLDGGSSVALYIRKAGVLVRGQRHKDAPENSQTVTSYVAFVPR
jgi:hypothetical protein